MKTLFLSRVHPPVVGGLEMINGKMRGGFRVGEDGKIEGKILGKRRGGG